MRHEAHLAEAARLEERRSQQALDWVREAIGARFGASGLQRAGELRLEPGQSPFACLTLLAERLGAN